MALNSREYLVYADGSCLGNPGPGGWAAILRAGDHEREISGAEPATTNNRMELMAAIRALEALKRRSTVTLHTDSRYVMDGVTKWIKRWKTNGWRTGDKKPVKNEDLWRNYVKSKRLHGLQTRDEKKDVGALFHVAGYPTYIVIDGDGMVRQRAVGIEGDLKGTVRIAASKLRFPYC